MSNKRKTISKKLRFEVFKRDSFTCQYCGNSFPNVILHVDHVDPVANGGTNSILNLLTACIDCNQGKRDRLLSDNTVVSKTLEQTKLLNEKRQQMQMMLKWRKGLLKLKNDELSKVTTVWEELTKTNLTQEYKKTIKSLLKKHGLEMVLNAIETSCEQYLQYDNQDNVTQKSIIEAFKKIAGILRVNKESKHNPYIKDAYYIRKILINREIDITNIDAIPLLETALRSGIGIEQLKKHARSVKSWHEFNYIVKELLTETVQKTASITENPRMIEKPTDFKLDRQSNLTGWTSSLQTDLVITYGFDEAHAKKVSDALDVYCEAFYQYIKEDEVDINPESIFPEVENFVGSEIFKKHKLIPLYHEYVNLTLLNDYLSSNKNSEILFNYLDFCKVETIQFPTRENYKVFAAFLKSTSLQGNNVKLFDYIQRAAGTNRLTVSSIIKKGTYAVLKEQFNICKAEVKPEKIMRLLNYYACGDILESLGFWLENSDDEGNVNYDVDPNRQYTWEGFITLVNNVYKIIPTAIHTVASVNDYMMLFEGINSRFNAILPHANGIFVEKFFDDWQSYPNRLDSVCVT